MKGNNQNAILKICKSKLNFFNVAKLYIFLSKLSQDDITFIKQFIDNYYEIDYLPSEFYNLFLNCIHSNRYQQLFKILIRKDIYEMISFLKNSPEIINEIEKIICPKEYFNLPIKHINTITEHLKRMEIKNNELPLKQKIAKKIQWLLKKTNYNTEEEYKIIAIKMYYSIGLENAIEILNGNYGDLDYELIHFLFINLDIKSNKDNDIIKTFLFSNKKDPNNILRQMLMGKENDILLNFDHFYNSIDFFVEKLGTKLNKDKLALLLQELYVASKVDNPELSGDILKDMISSYYHKYGISESESEILDKNLNAYNRKLKNKTRSSIISTKIPTIDDYTFELIPLNDARNLVMGYRAGNCFRINGDALILFDNFLTNPHMRIISISTKEHKDFGMVLLMRNGNALIAQGIEVSKWVPNEITGKRLYEAVRKALKYIMDEMNKNDDEIVASVIGLSNSNTSSYNNNILPFIINPIIDNNSNYYNGVANYQGLLDLKEDKTINDIKLFVPDHYYDEDALEILFRDAKEPHFDLNYREIEKILISLRFAKFKSSSQEEISQFYNKLFNKSEAYTICTRYWFIMVFTDNSIEFFINSDNSQVVLQFNTELNKVKQILHNSKLQLKKQKD
jgi:hypothetical protein